MSLMRDGFGDRTLLKRGDVFTPPLDNAHRFVVQGGESEIAPAMLWSYGTADAHPEIRNACVQVGFGGNPTRHMWVVGIDIINRDGMSIYYPATNPGVNNVGMSVEPYFGDDVLVEDCHIIGWGANLQAGPRGDNSFAGRLHNFRLRGCVIADAFYLGDASSQGFNCGSLSYPLMERCVVDHNGWSEEGVDDLSILNQNIYFYQNCNNITTRWNISMRACANGCQQRNGGLGEQSIFVNNPFHNLHGSTDGADHSIVRYCSYNGGRDLGLPDDNNGQQGSVGINTGTAVPNSVLQADFFTDSAGGDIDLNTADRFWQYPLVGGVQFRRWNVFGGAGTPVQQNGLAVATGGAFMKSTSANPVYCCEALDIGEGGNTIHEDDNQYSIVPMDPDLGPVSIFIRAQGSPGDDGHVFETLYRLELSRDEFGHDFVAIVERVAGVETDLVRTDLGDHAWTWGSEADTPADADVFSGDITTGVAHIRRGAPTGDGLGELLASSDIDNAQLLRAGPCGILLSGLNQRVYHVEVHSLYVYADVEVAECLFTGVDAEDVLRAKICMGISASGGRLNVHDNISYDFGVFQIQGAVLTAGPFYITNNVFVVPDSASEHYILYWEELVDPTPLIVFSGNGWYLGSGIYWNFNHQGIRTTNPSVWIAHSDETDGTYSIYPSMTPPAYLDPTRGPSTYEGYLERPATITEWYAHAREMNKNVAGSGINVPDFLNWQRAGFNKGPVPSV
jgi:hypothetical protein